MEVDELNGGALLSAKERQQWPYVVLVDPAGQRGAAYSSGHRLVVPVVSDELLRFALQRAVHAADWDDALDDRPRPRAPWMPHGSLAGWRLYWVRAAGSSREHLEALPKR